MAKYLCSLCKRQGKLLLNTTVYCITHYKTEKIKERTQNE